jgi:hypothetical protein
MLYNTSNNGSESELEQEGELNILLFVLVCIMCL